MFSTIFCTFWSLAQPFVEKIFRPHLAKLADFQNIFWHLFSHPLKGIWENAGPHSHRSVWELSRQSICFRHFCQKVGNGISRRRRSKKHFFSMNSLLKPQWMVVDGSSGHLFPYGKKAGRGWELNPASPADWISAALALSHARPPMVKCPFQLFGQPNICQSWGVDESSPNQISPTI